MSAIAPLVPRDLVDPGPPPVPTKTLTRWSSLLGAIATGMPLQDAMLKFWMTRADIEACVRSDPLERQKWDAARIAALKREWSVLEVEDVFAEIASGKSLKDAVAAVKGIETEDARRHAISFSRLVVQDQELNERYLLALKSRALVVGEEIIDIADDKTDDTLETGGKSGTVPNNANVNRSKLQVETRLRLMQGWYPKLFREKADQTTQVNVQVNHAARLEDARTRAAMKKPSAPTAVSRAQMEAAVDAVFSEAPKADLDTAWLDQ